MTAPVIKICGITSVGTAAAVAETTADMAGFMFVAKSVRHVTPAEAAALAQHIGPAAPVAVTVDADDATLDIIVETLRPHLLQLHGAETPERIATLKARYGLAVIKALPVAEVADVEAARIFDGVADWLLFDAKPPKSRPGATSPALPGGNGLAFDWTILEGRTPRTPWILSGGLTPDNVAAAIAATGARAVDVSSGVERAPGDKDPQLIRAFAAAARAKG